MESPIESKEVKRTFRHFVRSCSAILIAAIPFCGSLGCGNAIKLSKMGGDIDLDTAPNGAVLTTMGGSIHLGRVDGPAELKTMGGDIEVDSSSASLRATTMAGNVMVQVNEAGSNGRAQDIELQSNAGRITLLLPQNFGATVDATLAYTNNQQEAFAIVDDLGLHKTASSEWDRSKGSPRKYIHATGRIGDGRNHIVINTINGNITLQRKPVAAA